MPPERSGGEPHEAPTVEAPRAAAGSAPAPGRQWVDYSSEVRLLRHPLLRAGFVVAGFVAVGLGVVGYIVPGMPGTVFLLIATWFFAQSSPRFYNWVMNHRLFGPLIRDYRAGKGIPRWVKWYASAIILAVSSFSAWLVGVQRGNAVVGSLIVLTALFGVWYVFHVPTKAADPVARGRT